MIELTDSRWRELALRIAANGIREGKRYRYLNELWTIDLESEIKTITRENDRAVFVTESRFKIPLAKELTTNYPVKYAHCETAAELCQLLVQWGMQTFGEDLTDQAWQLANYNFAQRSQL